MQGLEHLSFKHSKHTVFATLLHYLYYIYLHNRLFVNSATILKVSQRLSTLCIPVIMLFSVRLLCSFALTWTFVGSI